MPKYLFEVDDEVTVGRDYRMGQWAGKIQFRFTEVIGEARIPVNQYIVSGHPSRGWTVVSESGIVPPTHPTGMERLDAGSVVTGRNNGQLYVVRARTESNYVIQIDGGGQEWLIPICDLVNGYQLKSGIWKEN